VRLASFHPLTPKGGSVYGWSKAFSTIDNVHPTHSEGVSVFEFLSSTHLRGTSVYGCPKANSTIGNVHPNHPKGVRAFGNFSSTHPEGVNAYCWPKASSPRTRVWRYGQIIVHMNGLVIKYLTLLPSTCVFSLKHSESKSKFIKVVMASLEPTTLLEKSFAFSSFNCFLIKLKVTINGLFCLMNDFLELMSSCKRITANFIDQEVNLEGFGKM